MANDPETSNTNHASHNNNESSTAPIPSTSTGITGNSKFYWWIVCINAMTNKWYFFFILLGALFRIVQAPDSDDEPSPENSPALHNVNHSVPIKLNGTNSTNLAQAYSSGVDDDQPNEIRHSRRKRNHSLTTNNYHFTNYSSHSSSRLSNSSSSDDTSSNDSRRKISRWKFILWFSLIFCWISYDSF